MKAPKPSGFDYTTLLKKSGHPALINNEVCFSYTRLLAEMARYTRYFREQAVSRAALFAENSPQWICALYAIWHNGCIAVPIDSQSTPAELLPILTDCQPQLLFCSRRNLAGLQAATAGLRHPPRVVIIAEIPPLEGAQPDYLNPVKAETTALIIYSSGTTGPPKGVMLSFANLFTQIRFIAQSIRFRTPQQRILSLLPYHHIFALQFTILIPLCLGYTVVQLNQLTAEEIFRVLQQHKVTGIAGVPALYTLLWNKLKARLDASLVTKWVSRLAAAAGSRFLAKILLAPVHKKFGGCLEYFLCGGAAVSRQVEEGLRGLGFDFMTGYGLTETSPLISSNTFTCWRTGSAGKPLYPDSVRISQGEITVKGPQVMQGYFKRSAETAGMIKAGWLYTGDLGYLDKDGFLFITGRKKEIIVTAGGKNINPLELETALTTARPYVLEAAVIEEQALLHALIRPDLKIPGSGGKQKIREQIQREVIDPYNAAAAPYKRIMKFSIVDSEFPRTPLGKLQRYKLPGLAAGSQEAQEQGQSESAGENTKSAEAFLVSVLGEVLGRAPEEIGFTTNYLDLGIDSVGLTTYLARISGHFRVKLSLEEIFAAPTVRQTAVRINQSEPAGTIVIPAAPPAASYPLSAAQQRLYVLHQFHPRSTSYNISGVLEIQGTLDLPRLEQTFRQVIARHESLRTAIVTEAKIPRQQVAADVPFKICLRESQGQGSAEAVTDFIRPFRLDKAPLLRVTCFRESAHNCLLLVDLHHIIADGTSLGIIMRDFMAFYNHTPLPALTLGYKDYALWQQTRRDSEEMARARAYWLAQFSEEIPRADLPCDFPRPKLKSMAGRRSAFSLPAPQLKRLQALARQGEGTLFQLLLTGVYVLTGKLTACEDIVIGTPQAGRSHSQLLPLVGMFVNTLALRNRPAGSLRFSDFFAQVKQNTWQAFAHQEYQFEELVGELKLPRDTARNPLFDVMFVFQNMEWQPLELEGLKIRQSEVRAGSSQFDLSLIVREEEEQLAFSLEYDSSLFKEATVQRFAAYYLKILSAVLADPHVKLAELALLGSAEKAQTLNQFRNPPAVYPRNRTIDSLFAAQVRKTPEAVAVLTCGEIPSAFSYRQLAERALAFACYLQARGLLPGEVVAISLPRSADYIAAILGVLRAGGVYLPLEPAYPPGRLRFMLTDSRARFLISAAGLAAASLVKETADREFPASLILTDEIPSPPQAGGEKLPQNSPGQLAYLIYTSGTTGKPRAVGVEHRNVVSLLQHEPFPFRFSSEDTWSLCHSFCFDFSVWELFGCLLSGGRCLVVPREIVTDPRQLLKVIRQYRVTVFNQTPSSFYNVMQECLKHPDPPLPLRYVIFGGESLAARRLAAFHRQFPLVRLINMYGITETTVHVTCKELTSRDLESPLNNIGRPLATLSCYLLDDNLQLVPRGVPGEICISGSQVARGYFGKEALTARKFIPHPLIPGERLYRSGDRGRWLNGDELEYLGRLDQQIQLRGHRIEPAEIEAALLELPEISSAVVVYRSGEAGGGSLSACYVASRELTPEALRRHLQQLLPDYMVPAFFFRIAEIPLTANGKLMPEALPLPAEGKYSRPVYQPPEEGLQQQLSALWEKVLGIGGIGVRDNFFDSGGDSLLIVRLQAELEQLFPGRCRIVDIFNHPTIESLAEFIDSKAESFNLPLLHLPGRFFTAAAQNPYPGYFFLEPALSLNLRNLAAQRGLSPGRLLLEAFLRLLAGLSEEERFPVQTALHQPGRGSCLYADPAGNGGELALSAGSSAGEYALPELAQLPLLREKNRALVLFYKQGCLTGFEYLLPCFDLALGFQIRQQQTGFRLQHSQRIAAGSAAELAAGYQQACGSLLQTAATADRRL